MLRGLLAIVAAVAVWVAACGGAEPTATPTAAPHSPIVGIVTSVDSSGLDEVHGFTLRDSSGRVYTFKIGTLENAAEFPPGHLGEHRLTAEPIQVWFHAEPTGLVAYRLGDAPSPSPSVAPSPSVSQAAS